MFSSQENLNDKLKDEEFIKERRRNYSQKSRNNKKNKNEDINFYAFSSSDKSLGIEPEVFLQDQANHMQH
jgi:hypothetical protein